MRGPLAPVENLGEAVEKTVLAIAAACRPKTPAKATRRHRLEHPALR